MEFSVFGVAAWEHFDGAPRQTNFVITSKVIERSARAVSCVLDCLKSHLRTLQTATSISIWCDAGTHFRSCENIAYWRHHWYEILAATMRSNYFVEKHGKGLIDALFSLVQRWVAQALQVPGARIGAYEEMLQVLRKGAAGQQIVDPNGIQHRVFGLGVGTKTGNSHAWWISRFSGNENVVFRICSSIREPGKSSHSGFLFV